MNSQKEQEWIADNNENTQAQQPLIIPSTVAQTIDKIDIEPTIEPQNTSITQQSLKKSLLQLQHQKQKIKQVTCIDDFNIAMIMFIGKKMQLQGRLKVTNITLSFMFKGKNDVEQVFIQIPIGYIGKCQRSTVDRISIIQIWLKYGCSFKISYTQNKFQTSAKTYQIINKLIQTSVKFALQYASNFTSQFYCQRFTCGGNGANAYQYDNDNWKRFPNYPEKFLVPLSYLSKNNPEERIVIFSFCYQSPKNKLSFWRTGPGKCDSSQQEWIIKSRLPIAKSYTLQIKNKGIGTSKSHCSKAIQLQSPYHTKESFSNTFRVAYHNHESLKWLSNLNQTRWLDQIAVILQESSLLVEKILKEQTQTITLIADNDSRGAQIAAITQVLLFPQYRSIKGFSKLLQTQFLQWGVQKSSKKQIQIDKGSVFIQFLDAVFQLTCIYPLSFQFNQSFLVFIAQNIYSNKFGNFLLISKFIRQQEREMIYKSCSIWSVLQSQLKDPGIRSLYINPFFVNHKQCDIYELRQFPSPKYLRIWGGFFFKKFKDKNIDYQISQRYQHINIQHFNNKLKTEQLRLQLSEQQKKLIQRKQILRDLKALQ